MASKVNRQPLNLPVQPVLWGLAVDRDGRAIVSLEDGRVMCFGVSDARP